MIWQVFGKLFKILWRSFLVFSAMLTIMVALGGFFLFISENRPDLSYLLEELPLRLSFKEIAQKEVLVPEAQNPKEVTYSWQYKNKDYSLDFVLYESIYNFYKTKTKAYEYFGKLPQNWEEEYYGIFVNQPNNDSTITELATSLEKLGKENGLSEDQTVEMIVAFIQTIPFDDDKAFNILNTPTGEQPRYPYEVLYDNRGVCSEKSFLLTALLRELGYGTVLLEYEKENHMAVGIQCPKEYANYESGYCYTETTTPGHKIGIIPHLDPNSNAALAQQQSLDYFDAGSSGASGQDDYKKPNEVRFFQKTTGKTYAGIEKTKADITKAGQLEEEISQLKKELKIVKDKIDKKSNRADDLNEELERLKKKEEYEKYNELVKEYNELVLELKELTAEYNKKVKEHNQAVTEYNKLIKGS